MANERKDELDFEIAFFEKLVRDKPDFVDALIPLGDLYTRRGYYAKGLEIDNRLSRLCPADERVFYNLACSYILLHDKKRAFAALERAIDLGYGDVDHMLRDPDLAAIRDDPQFHQLTEKIKNRLSAREGS